ncbi:MAG TPA: hypothetical protein PKY88_12560 [Anaerohalosphaeraceae bacterium]|nr:hypothetical protein [Anaerohalosphaeraceae bacterium]
MKKLTGYSLKTLMSSGIFLLEKSLEAGDFSPILNAKQRELDGEFQVFRESQPEATG